MLLFSLLTNSSTVISELLFTFSSFLQKICLITYGLLFCASAIFASLSFLAVQGLQNICGVKCNFLPGIGAVQHWWCFCSHQRNYASISLNIVQQ